MKKLISTLKIATLLFFAGSMTAQDYANRAFTSSLFIVDEYVKRQDGNMNYDDEDSYTGTPFNHPSYLLGNVYNGDELLANDVALRYNAVADEMEIKESLVSPDEDARVLTKSPDIYVKIMDDIYVFVPYMGGVEGGGYFQVMYEGTKVDLFKKLKKDFTPEKKATSSITRDIPAKFTDDITYYLADKDGKFYELPNSRRKKLKVFAKKEDDMKDYVNDNDLDLNEEKDLMRAVKHFDSEM
ncbi:MAG: hypothetical protein R3359_03060 [Marinirhabdus sp.]|nr:hypothetical protein [Marinirhabdus sp.]